MTSPLRSDASHVRKSTCSQCNSVVNKAAEGVYVESRYPTMRRRRRNITNLAGRLM